MDGKERRARMLGKTMKESFSNIANEYLRIFCEKHDLEYNPGDWVGSEDGIGTVVNPGGGDLWIDFDTIRYDIDHAVPKEVFEQYSDYEDKLRNIELGYEILYKPNREEGKLVHINYPSFCKGCPRPYTDAQLAKMQSDLDYQTKQKEEFLKFIAGEEEKK